MIDKIIQNSIIFRENVYNMNETKIMLNMLDFVKVLVNKNDLRNYKNANVKRTMITIIECVNANDKSLLFLII